MQDAAMVRDETAPSASGPPRVLSVIIPAFNEETVIATTLRSLVARLDAAKFDYELLVVNDGSYDQTEQIVADLERVLPRLRHINSAGPHGYGYAVRFGLAHYTGDAVAIVMADGSDSPDDLIEYFVSICNGYDCAFGHRFSGRSRVKGYPRGKAILNRMGNWLIAAVLRHRYTDFTNGFKCFRRHVIDGMQPLISGQFNLTVEMSVSAILGGAQYALICNGWTGRTAGESKFRMLRMGPLYLLTLAYCLLRHWLKKLDRASGRRQ